MKIAWLCQYPVYHFEKELGYKIKRRTHPSSWILNLSREISKDSEVELHIVTLSPYIRSDIHIKKDNIDFHILKSFYKVPFVHLGLPQFLPFDYITNWRLNKSKLDRKLNEIKPDITHIHGIETQYGISDYAKDKPHIVTVQGIGNLINKGVTNYYIKKENNIENKIIRKYKNYGSRTEFANNYIKSINKSAKIYFTTEAINEVFFEETEKQFKPNIVYVGYIMERKGIEVLIGSIRILHEKIDNIQVTLIGTGDKKYIDKINYLIREFKLEKIIKLCGFKNSIEINEIFNENSIFIFPTFIDNSPNSLIEAMAAGLICVASNTGGIPSIIKDKENGILFETGNSLELANICYEILSNKSKYDSISKNAQKFAREYYSPRIAANIFKEVYITILKNFHENLFLAFNKTKHIK